MHILVHIGLQLVSYDLLNGFSHCYYLKKGLKIDQSRNRTTAPRSFGQGVSRMLQPELDLLDSEKTFVDYAEAGKPVIGLKGWHD